MGLVRAAVRHLFQTCLLYTSDAADDLLCVDLGGRRIIKKKNKIRTEHRTIRTRVKINRHHSVGTE